MEIDLTISQYSSDNRLVYIGDLLLRYKEAILRNTDAGTIVVLKNQLHNFGVPVSIDTIDTFLQMYSDVTGPVKFWIDGDTVYRVQSFQMASQIYFDLLNRLRFEADTESQRELSTRIQEWEDFALCVIEK
jgi:hypothetical protein